VYVRFPSLNCQSTHIEIHHRSLGTLYPLHYPQTNFLNGRRPSISLSKNKKGGSGRRDETRSGEATETRDTPRRNRDRLFLSRGLETRIPDKDPSFCPQSIPRATSLNGFKRSPRRQCRQHATELGQYAPAGRKFWFIIVTTLVRDTREKES